MRGRQRCLRIRQCCPALSFYSPKTEEREVWPQDRGSDGEKEWRDKKGKKRKNRKWPWEDCRRSRAYMTRAEWRESEMAIRQEKEWGQEEKKDKRCRFNELSLTVGDMRSSPRLKRIKGEVCTFIQALKQFPHAGWMKLKMKWGKPGLVFRLKQLLQMYTHAQLIHEIRNGHKECGRCST